MACNPRVEFLGAFDHGVRDRSNQIGPDGSLQLSYTDLTSRTAAVIYSDLREAISMEKRYFTSDLSILS